MKIIRDIKYYRPLEIAEHEFITNSRGGHGKLMSRYGYILALIRSGELKARNYGKKEGRPYWMVSEKEIKRYNDSLVKGD